MEKTTKSEGQDSWLVSRIDATGFEIVAQCVALADLKGQSHETRDLGFGPSRIILGAFPLTVNVTSERQGKQWRLYVGLPGMYPYLDHLGDSSEHCRGCHQPIADVVISPEGRILIGHA